MNKATLTVLLTCAIIIGTGNCGSGEKDVTEVTKNQEKMQVSVKNDRVETKNDRTDGENDHAEDRKTGNPLLDAELNICSAMNGNTTEELGEYAYVKLSPEVIKNVTMDQYDEFCSQKVQDSGYNWVTIDFGNGYGLQFQGSIPAVSIYGNLDNAECVEESSGVVMLVGEGTYEYFENE